MQKARSYGIWKFKFKLQQFLWKRIVDRSTSLKMTFYWKIKKLFHENLKNYDCNIRNINFVSFVPFSVKFQECQVKIVGFLIKKSYQIGSVTSWHFEKKNKTIKCFWKRFRSFFVNFSARKLILLKFWFQKKFYFLSSYQLSSALLHWLHFERSSFFNDSLLTWHFSKAWSAGSTLSQAGKARRVKILT